MEVKVGDIIIPGPNNGLGRGKFKVLYIYPEPCLFPICVGGSNGQQWWIRREGIKVVK